MLSRLMTGREQLVLVFVASAVFIGVVSLVVDRIQADAPLILDDAPIDVPRSTLPTVERLIVLPDIPTEPEPSEVAVSIQGAIELPGPYRLEDDARVQDLIERAGGLAEEADTSNINLAARLIDATTLTVPAGVVVRREGQSARFERRRQDPVWNPPHYTIQGWQPHTAGSAGSNPATAQSNRAASSPLSINVNTASKAELETLPGIGPAYAAAIIEYRKLNNFLTVDELQAVSGIGAKRLEAIRQLVRVK